MNKHARNYFLFPLVFSMLFIAALPARLRADEQLKILSSTFPIHQIARNVALGSPNIDLDLLLPAQLGCPHNYTLSPHDMQRIAKADALIINGLGLEDISAWPLASANPKIQIIDSSQGIRNLINNHYPDQHNYRNEAEHHSHSDLSEAKNPHLFVSPHLVASIAVNIANELARLDPTEASRYLSNAKRYATKMESLANDISGFNKQLKHKRVVSQHGVFDYLARDLGLEIVTVIQPNTKQQPSAADALSIIRIIKQKKVEAILLEPQFSQEIGQTIADETGIPVCLLNPGTNGPRDASLDYFEEIMRKNILVLVKALGSD